VIPDPATEQLVRAAVPDYAVRSVEWNSDGLQFLVAVINGQWVVRIPRSAQAAEDLVREAEVLRSLHPLVSLPLPAYDRVTPEWGRYLLLPGASLSRSLLLRASASWQAECGAQLGRFLRELHQATTVIRRNGLARVSSAQWSRDG
jgi:aminoglycoside phosphotransferase (APT) family kinase protein